MVRTTQNLSEIAASRGRCSPISRPGVREAMGRNGPRIFSGASGFRSKVSSWLGPPNRKRKITDLARATGAAGVARASAASSPGRLMPNRPAPAASSSVRRVMPSHVLRRGPSMRNMRGPSVGGSVRPSCVARAWIVAADSRITGDRSPGRSTPVRGPIPRHHTRKGRGERRHFRHLRDGRTRNAA